MAIQVSSIAELERVMMEQTQKFMEKSSNKLINEIEQSIDETVYSYNPDRYKRTKQLQKTLRLDKQQSTSGLKKASIVVNHNTDNAVWFSVGSGKLRKDIPEIVTYGAYGTIKGRGIYAYGSDYHDINPSLEQSKEWAKPRDYMKHAEEKLEGYGYLNRCLQSHLPSYVIIK